MHLQRIDMVWLGLLAATGVTVALGEAGVVHGHAWALLTIFALVLLKGAWIALDFMELRDAPPLWRRLVLGWLVLVVALIVLAWALTSAV